MKAVNITDIPLFSKDNISASIQVALESYPPGTQIYFPSGTYRFHTHTSFAGEKNYPKSGLAVYGLFDLGTVPFMRNRITEAQFPRTKMTVPSISWVEFLKSF